MDFEVSDYSDIESQVIARETIQEFIKPYLTQYTANILKDEQWRLKQMHSTYVKTKRYETKMINRYTGARIVKQDIECQTDNDKLYQALGKAWGKTGHQVKKLLEDTVAMIFWASDWQGQDSPEIK